MEIIFSNPGNLWLLLTVPVLILTHFLVLNFLKRRAFRFANFDVIRRIVGPEGNRKNSQFLSENFVLLILRVLAVIFLVLAAAGATLWYQGMGSKFSYVIAIDASSSMLANDMQPNRLEAAKKAAGDFVGMLSLARAGVIDFSGVSFVRQPITDDLSLSRNAIANIGIEDVGGTAIGDSIITATNLLSQEDNARVVILITDGQSNVGAEVKEGIEHANNANTVVHTIGIGTEQGGAFIRTELISMLDEESLKLIAESTGGKYFRASDSQAIQSAYENIADMSSQKLSIRLSAALISLAVIFIFIEWTLLNTKYRALP